MPKRPGKPTAMHWPLGCDGLLQQLCRQNRKLKYLYPFLDPKSDGIKSFIILSQTKMDDSF
jgi:hypothetical protein